MNVLTALPPETLRALTADELAAVAIAVSPQDADASGAVVDELGRRRVVDPEVLEGLRLLAHEDAAHVDVGGEVLERHGHRLDVADDLRRATALCEDPDPASRRRALQVAPAALLERGRVQRVRLTFALTLATMDDDPAVVVAAIGVLGARGDAEGLLALLRNVGHPVRRVREAVARHLPAVAGEPPHRRPADACPELVGETERSVRALALVVSPQDQGDGAAKGDRTGSRSPNAGRSREDGGSITTHPDEPMPVTYLRRHAAAASPVGDVRLLAALLRLRFQDGDNRTKELAEAIQAAAKRCHEQLSRSLQFYICRFYADTETERLIETAVSIFDAGYDLQHAAQDRTDTSVQELLPRSIDLVFGDIVTASIDIQEELRQRDDDATLRRVMDLCAQADPNGMFVGLSLLGDRVGEALHEMALPRVIELCRHNDPRVVSHALHALSRLEDISGLPTLVALVDSDRADHRLFAAEGVCRLAQAHADRESLDALLRLTTHADERVRVTAVAGLQECDDDLAGLDALAACLDDDAPDVRAGAVVSLAAHKDERAVRPILEALSDGTTETWVLNAIFYFPDARFVRALERLRADPAAPAGCRQTHLEIAIEDCRLASRRPLWMMRAVVGRTRRQIRQLSDCAWREIREWVASWWV